MKRVGFRVRALRRMRGVSQAQLQKKTGISQSQISKIEAEGRMRTLEDFAEILKFFQISVKRFLKGIYEVD